MGAAAMHDRGEARPWRCHAEIGLGLGHYHGERRGAREWWGRGTTERVRGRHCARGSRALYGEDLPQIEVHQLVSAAGVDSARRSPLIEGDYGIFGVGRPDDLAYALIPNLQRVTSVRSR